jgi:hypothetical protein
VIVAIDDAAQTSQLGRILECFNLQVSSPCALVDQATSRRVLDGDGAERYKYFLEATGVQVLSHTVLITMI